MKQNHSSRTAEYMALFRALETVQPEKKALFADPYAELFLSRNLLLAAQVARIQPVGNLIRFYIDKRWPGARTAAVGRTRFIDEVTKDAVRQGITQVVILGAGFDTRAWRTIDLAAVKVFEVDHPDTTARKQLLLGQ